MKSVTVTLTLKLENEMDEKTIEQMMDNAILHIDSVRYWTLKVEDSPELYWEEVSHDR